jgi:hypothetical protein
VTLTELLYENEYNSLPLDDIFPPGNSVHFCVRLDAMLQKQVAVFASTGIVIDPYEKDGCLREKSSC